MGFASNCLLAMRGQPKSSSFSQNLADVLLTGAVGQLPMLLDFSFNLDCVLCTFRNIDVGQMRLHSEKMMDALFMRVVTDEMVTRRHASIRLIVLVLFAANSISFEFLVSIIPAHRLTEYIRKLLDVLLMKTVEEDDGTALAIKCLCLLSSVESARLILENHSSLHLLASRPLSQVELHNFLVFCALTPSVLLRMNASVMNRFLAREWETFLDSDKPAAQLRVVSDRKSSHPSALNRKSSWFSGITWSSLWAGDSDESSRRNSSEHTPLPVVTWDCGPSLVVMYHLPPVVSPDLLRSFEQVFETVLSRAIDGVSVSLCKLALYLARVLIDNRSLPPGIFEVVFRFLDARAFPQDHDLIQLAIAVIHHSVLTSGCLAKLESVSLPNIVDCMIKLVSDLGVFELDVVAVVSAVIVFGSRLVNVASHQYLIAHCLRSSPFWRSLYLRCEAAKPDSISILDQAFNVVFDLQKHFVQQCGYVGIENLSLDAITKRFVLPHYETWMRTAHVVSAVVGGIWSVPDAFRAVPNLCRHVVSPRSALDL